MAKLARMATPKPGSKRQPFARKRPTIEITRSHAKPFAVDCRELRWCFGRPIVGERTLWATYDAPDWRLTSATEMVALRPARVNDVAGVEIQVNDWSPETGWEVDWRRMFGRVTDTAVQWLATWQVRPDESVLDTFLEEGFQQDWRGEEPRKLEDRGRYVLGKDGTYTTRAALRNKPGAIGAGMFRVHIGSRAFTCLRVLDTNGAPDERGMLLEVYLTRNGRTVLWRRYNGRVWQEGLLRGRGLTWDDMGECEQIVIDGCLFVHWYDCLTGLAVGIK